MRGSENVCRADRHDVTGSVNGFVFKYYKKTSVIWTEGGISQNEWKSVT